MSDTIRECVGFADCPCPKCRRTRYEATATHDEHTRHNSYCGVCRTIDLQANYIGARA